MATAEYPEHWEADVVLRDGSTAHVRPILPEDEALLAEFHSRLSPDTIYFRFFAPYPELTARDLKRFTHVDYRDRAALVALVAEEFVGVARYDRVSPDSAEVAFTIRDDYQGFGLGSVLLEHIGAAARERGIGRFVADVLPANRRMIAVFVDAGYTTEQEFEDGVIMLHFDLEPTAQSVAVLEAREQRSEALSIQRLMSPRSIAVIGASRTPGAVGHELLRHVIDGGFAGPIRPIHPSADKVLGLPAFRTVVEAGTDVDLAVVAVPAAAIPGVIEDCARAGVKGLVVVSTGFGEAGAEGRKLQRELVNRARGSGMRVVGPACFGLINTANRMNASLAPTPPLPGGIGFFSQSGSLGSALLASARRHGLGLSSFVSAGNRADVSGNDLLQYWQDDPETQVVLLYLESFGNPRKFTRISRRLAASKPVVAVRSGRTTQAYPLGNRMRRTSLSPAAVDALFARSGIVQTDTVGELFDVAGLLAFQPRPAGDRVGVLGNSSALVVQTAGACETAGLTSPEQVTLPYNVERQQFEASLGQMSGRADIDSLIVLHVPPLGDVDDQIRTALLAHSLVTGKPVVAVLPAAMDATGLLALTDDAGAAATGSVPVFGDIESAVRALAHVSRYANWVRAPRGSIPDFADVEADRARSIVERFSIGEDEIELSMGDAADLLGCYGIRPWPSIPVGDEDAAARTADLLGYPVVMRTLIEELGGRTDLGGLRLNLENERAVRTAYRSMFAKLAAPAAAALAVQRQAPSGIGVVIESVEDPLFGPVISFRLGGVVPALLDDRAYCVPPVTDLDAHDLVRAPGAAPMLIDAGSSLSAVEELVLRVARLVEDLPEVSFLALDPIMVSTHGAIALGAHIRLAEPSSRIAAARRLPETM